MPDEAGDRPAELVEALDVLDHASPPRGMQQRVMLAIETSPSKPVLRPRRAALVAAALVATSAAAAVFSLYANRPTVHIPSAVSASSAPSTTEPHRGPAPAPAPTTRASASAEAPAASAPTRPAPPSRSAESAPSDLALQVAAYERAMALTGKNDEAALAAFRSMRARWPGGALAHEVDLRILELLVRTGQADKSRKEADEFVKRHPDSPKASEVEAIRDAGVKKN